MENEIPVLPKLATGGIVDPKDMFGLHNSNDDDARIMGKMVNILGTPYFILRRTREEDKDLNNCDGYCDATSHRIIVLADNPNKLDDFKELQRRTLRHEIIHAFLNESGLQSNFKHTEYGHEETIIDSIALQFPKILEVYREVGCI